MIRMVEMSVRLGISSRGSRKLGTKKGRADRASLEPKREVSLARGWSLDQIPQSRNPENGPSTGISRLRPTGSARQARLLGTGVRKTWAGISVWPAEPKLRSSVGWRPGLDLNQDKERCTVLAWTLPPPGRSDHCRSRRGEPRLPLVNPNGPAAFGVIGIKAGGAPRRSCATDYVRYWSGRGWR